MPRKPVASVRRHIEGVRRRVLLAPARVSASPDLSIGLHPTLDTRAQPGPNTPPYERLRSREKIAAAQLSPLAGSLLPSGCGLQTQPNDAALVRLGATFGVLV